MATKAQIQANRRNAKRSTGPKTPEGKARSSLNALKHGIRAQAIVSAQVKILGEDPQEFAALLQDLVDEFQPVGTFEEMCVENIAIAFWRLRRIVRAEMGYISAQQIRERIPEFAKTPSGDLYRSLPSFKILDKLTRYEAYVEKQLNQAMVLINKLQMMRPKPVETQSLAPEPTTPPNEAIPDPKVGILREIIKHLAQENTNLLAAKANKAKKHPDDELSHPVEEQFIAPEPTPLPNKPNSPNPSSDVSDAAPTPVGVQCTAPESPAPEPTTPPNEANSDKTRSKEPKTFIITGSNYERRMALANESSLPNKPKPEATPPG